MGILYWILMGLIVGLLARLIMPGRDPGGIIITILSGIGGAILILILYPLIKKRQDT